MRRLQLIGGMHSLLTQFIFKHTELALLSKNDDSSGGHVRSTNLIVQKKIVRLELVGRSFYKCSYLRLSSPATSKRRS